jgi:hypothetical protein
MAHDRVPANKLALTHEFLSLMMGAGRPGVTEAIHSLANKGLIRGGRGVIAIVDRNGLIERAGAFYGTPEAEYARLFGAEENRGLHVV